MADKILLIAPLFFGYYKEIMKEAENLGYEIDYICDAPSDSNISKAIGRINKRFIVGKTKSYFDKEVLPKLKGKSYQYVLVIAGMTFSFTPEMMEKIRKMNSKAKFVIYQWDSEKNLPYVTEIHKFFDELYSFDLHDCEKKKKYQFLPLFYTKLYEEIGEQSTGEYKYDCSYVGTAHPQKYKDINMMADQLKKVFPKQFVYHYMPSKLKYLYHKLLASEFKYAKWSDFQTEKVPANQMMEIFKDSKCILDAPQAGQTGLTIRTIECLGAKRKLVTTNADIKRYDFYDPVNIIVFDENIDLYSNFFTSNYRQIEKSIYEKYSLKEWLKVMLKEK